MCFVAFVVLFHTLPLLFMPESPRYLLIQKKDEANAKQGKMSPHGTQTQEVGILRGCNLFTLKGVVSQGGN